MEHLIPFYFMNVRYQHDLIKDQEGMEFPDLESAQKSALFSAKQIIAESLKAGNPIKEAMSKTVEITDEKGGVVTEVPFAEGATADLRGMYQQERAGNLQP